MEPKLKAIGSKTKTMVMYYLPGQKVINMKANLKQERNKELEDSNGLMAADSTMVSSSTTTLKVRVRLISRMEVNTTALGRTTKWRE